MKSQGLLEKYVKSAVGRDTIGNPEFQAHAQRVLYNVRNRTLGGSKTYETNGDAGLLEECMVHARMNSKPLTSSNVIVLVHPFYLSICDWPGLQALHISDRTDYEKLMSRLFTYKQDMDANIVVLDTAHFYADCTSRLLKDNLIDAAFITEFDGGYLEAKEDLSALNNKKLFFGGMFSGYCISESITELAKYSGNNRIKAIKDLILDHPDNFYDTTIKSESVTYYHNTFERYVVGNDVLTLKQFFYMTRKRI